MVWKAICLSFFISLLHGESIERSLNEANTLIILGAPERAIPLYQRILTQELKPKEKLITLYNLGTALLENQEPEKSLVPFQEAINITSPIQKQIEENTARAFEQLAKKTDNELLKAHYKKQASGKSLAIPIKTPELDASARAKAEKLLTPTENEGEDSLVLRNTAVTLLLEEKSGAKSIQEILERGIQRQKDAMFLAKLLPFQNPYSPHASPLVLEFQKRVSEIGASFVPALIQFQKDNSTNCPQFTWEAATEHLQAGLDLSQMAEQALKKELLPYPHVLPLQMMALAEWEKALAKLLEIPEFASDKPQATTKSVEKLKELFYQDKVEEKQGFSPVPEGVVW